MKKFGGFPPGKMPLTPVPGPFFAELLPMIDSLTELKVTLHVIWRLDQKRSYPAYVSRGELLNDATLISGFQSNAEACIAEGLEKAVARGTLLALVAERGSGGAGETKETLYFLNSEKGRQAVAQLQNGELELPEVTIRPQPGAERERPNIFVLYEQNIGLLQPLIAEELQEAEQNYPAEWIEDAFREAVAHNKRSWRYIRAILERWRAEGRGELAERGRRKYIEGKYAEYFKRRPKDE